MIAHARSPRSFQSKAHGAFVAMLPTIRRYADIAFRQFTAEAREEAIQEVIANAFVAFARLVQRGRRNAAFPSVLARYAVAQFFDGRRVGTPLNVRDVMSPYAQRRKRVVVERLDRFDPHEEVWHEAVVEDSRTPVIDQVWFRIDFPDWLSRLSARNRRVAQSLAAGESTGDVARQFGISPARISQLRGELHDAWQQFQGENELQPSAC
jgi:hypothetical protein